MIRKLGFVLLGIFLSITAFSQTTQSGNSADEAIRGFRNAAVEHQLERKFMQVPNAKLAGEHLKILTAAPHVAGSPEDYKTAQYVAEKFREAGLDTRIDEYKVWINYPKDIRVELMTPDGPKLLGPTREHVPGDPYDNDPRVVTPYTGGAASGDVTADVVYANYGRPEDFKKLKDMGISVKGKIVLVRYGQNFRGVKAFIAQQEGAAGVIIYSDPMDDGYFRGDAYPKGPWRPATGVQRGSIEYMFEYPGDPTTPGVASTMNLPDSERISPDKAANLGRIPVTPLSYHDAAPILESLGGPDTPREWQGALPFTYHVGPGPMKVHLRAIQDYKFVTLWDVIGTVRGTEHPNQLVIAGNHRDAWVFGAVDPNSGTAAMLETIHGVGNLLKSGWKPKRTIMFASWDGEEEGLIGSTEFAEQYATQLKKAVAYFNMDVGVAGPNFGASAVPSLKPFIRDITQAVPSPKGGTVYDAWKSEGERARRSRGHEAAGRSVDVPVGTLGSGSDYTAFLQHLGIPSTDVSSGGPYGVYHSAFDDYAWFVQNADPTFAYEQEMARIFGLEVLRMAQSDVLPLDYALYGNTIRGYLEAARRRVEEAHWSTNIDFGPALEAADRFAAAGKKLNAVEKEPPEHAEKANEALMEAERALLTKGLPNRPWFKHAIYAPGEYTGYAAVVIPGVNEAIDRNDPTRTAAQLAEVTKALNRAAETLESAH